MSKKGKIYIALVVLSILALVVFEMTKPKQINWFPSYATHHKIPFGSYVFNEQLNLISDSVITVNKPPFEYLRNNDINGTYLFYNDNVNFGKAELESLLDWTAKGNTLVVSSLNFETKLIDTLNLNMASVNIFDNFENKFQLQLVNPAFDKIQYEFDKASTLFHFNEIDTLNTKVLGVVDKSRKASDTESKPSVNLIKQPWGDGAIILNAFPQAFTNYFILNSPNQNYTVGLLSYLDTSKPIYIDQHYKSGKKFYTSPMYLFLNNPNLKWAYYIVLIGVLVYIIFEGKRKQRAIPVVKPLKNQTVDFTRTIANMYYESGKHSEIAHHKIQHFLEYIRKHMYLDTSTINAEFIKNLAARSNNTIENTKKLFDYINNLQEQHQLNNIQLERLNGLIETFKSHNQWKTKQ
ncbi:MAG: DUF4350 domain-containing protein [Winogradskyella sp.]|uniref:DUF4350 domain-containing protein n=1 Tax=Winogradskyella sp. TaxID=1883156 RepID=UPI00185AB7F7|nr:DUF4350 domain-containing protein [Winogradskyella sp.]MBT8244879.1 DUF4350 domain-containing protein [Winogradskyella sp.]NNK21837.1 DUF4350 domain-containing protein [Winogradskyella sp.]